MDIATLEKFLNYKPVYEKDPKFLLQEIKSLASEYLSDNDLKEIDKAYDFAKIAHEGQMRQSGEPYFVHPLKATLFLMKIRPGVKTIQTCILHDVIEDTEYNYDDIKERFGQEVADLCYGLEKVSRVRYEGQDRNLETLKKTFLAMGKDLRVIFVKLADRIHNIQTLKYHPKEEKKQRIANETLKIYVPIAQRLGLSIFQNYLENGSFYVINPKEFTRIFNHIKKKHGYNNHYYVDEGVKKIETALDEAGINYKTVKGRLKSPYRVHKKLKKYGTDDPNKVMDVLAFRVVTQSITDCYSALGVINNNYTPLIKKIKDYIALPKVNGYKSLHTTVIGMFKFPVEIQIRDEDMDSFAEFGVAAHFAYKEKGDSARISQEQVNWIRKLQEIVNTFQEAEKNEDFKNTLEIEALDKNIFVYTPAGDVIEMPQGSTVLDFAFKIHTDVGLKFKAAFVDDKIVPIDYRLKTGSIVEIKTYKRKYSATAAWLKFLHNPSSKAKLNRYVRQSQIKDHVEKAKLLLNEKLLSYGLPVLGSKSDLIASNNSEQSLENNLLKIYDKQISPTKFIKEYYKNINIPKNSSGDESSDSLGPVKDKSNLSKKVVIDGYDNLNYFFCPECNPSNDSKIIGKSTRDGIKIHSLDCKALDTISYDKLLESHWEGYDYNKYFMRIKLKAEDKPGVLLQILMIFSDFSVNIDDINVYSKKTGYSLINIDLEFNNPSKMQFVIKELKNKNELVKIVSKKIY